MFTDFLLIMAEAKPPSKVSQLRSAIYGPGPPRPDFGPGYPTQADIIQVWIYLNEQQKTALGVKLLRPEQKDPLWSDLCKILIDHWESQNPPVTINGDEHRLKVYKEVMPEASWSA